MTMRTTEKTITFHRPFCLKGVDSVLPPADYRVVTDEELIEGLSFVAYHRVSTIIFVPAPSGSAVEMVTVDPLELLLGWLMPIPHIDDVSRFSLRLLSWMETRLKQPRGVATYLGAGADLAALQHRVDFTLGLRLLEAILGHDLSHEVGLALKRGDLLLGRVH